MVEPACTLADRLEALIAIVPKPKLSMRELERLAGVRRGTVEALIRRRATGASLATLQGCAAVFGVSLEALSGTADLPPDARVIKAVKAARERGEHGATRSPEAATRKLRARAAGAA